MRETADNKILILYSTKIGADRNILDSTLMVRCVLGIIPWARILTPSYLVRGSYEINIHICAIKFSQQAFHFKYSFIFLIVIISAACPESV
jgi:hypothetical protein